MAICFAIYKEKSVPVLQFIWVPWSQGMGVDGNETCAIIVVDEKFKRIPIRELKFESRWNKRN